MNHLKVETSPFFRASCGCIGLFTAGGDEWHIIKACNGDGQDEEPLLQLMARRFDPEKDYVPLNREETLLVLNEMAGLINQGHALRMIASVLGQMWGYKPAARLNTNMKLPPVTLIRPEPMPGDPAA